MIGAYLRRALARAEAEGSRDPFASGQLATASPGGASTLDDVAAAPAAFIDEVLPFVTRVAEGTAGPEVPGQLRRSARLRWRHVDGHHGVEGAVFAGVEKALLGLAREQPETAARLVRPLAGSDVAELRFLACRTYTALACGDDAVDWLLSDERNLDLGWAESPRWASRELVESATRHCDDRHLAALTLRMLDYYPTWETTVDRRHLRGHAQYELLSAIDPGRHSNAAVRRLAEHDVASGG